MEEKTTIQISQEFKDWLEKQGAKSETYEDVLHRLTKYPDNKKG